MAKIAQRDPGKIIHILTIVLGILIFYSIVITFSFMFAIDELEHAEARISSMEIRE